MDHCGIFFGKEMVLMFFQITFVVLIRISFIDTVLIFFWVASSFEKNNKIWYCIIPFQCFHNLYIGLCLKQLVVYIHIFLSIPMHVHCDTILFEFIHDCLAVGLSVISKLQVKIARTMLGTVCNTITAIRHLSVFLSVICMHLLEVWINLQKNRKHLLIALTVKS